VIEERLRRSGTGRERPACAVSESRESQPAGSAAAAGGRDGDSPELRRLNVSLFTQRMTTVSGHKKHDKQHKMIVLTDTENMKQVIEEENK
jgi:hypothetical protein